MSRDKIIYISGAYSGESYDDIHQNIQQARKWAIRIWEMGFTALCPHLNTFHFETDCSIAYDDYLFGDLAMLYPCAGIFMLPDWRESNGAQIEWTGARYWEIPQFESLVLLEKYSFPAYRILEFPVHFTQDVKSILIMHKIYVQQGFFDHALQ